MMMKKKIKIEKDKMKRETQISREWEAKYNLQKDIC